MPPSPILELDLRSALSQCRQFNLPLKDFGLTHYLLP